MLIDSNTPSYINIIIHKYILFIYYSIWASLVTQMAKNPSTCSAGDLGSIPGLGRSPGGERKGYPLQYSGLENSMHCIVHGVAKSRIQLSYFHFHYCSSIMRL